MRQSLANVLIHIIISAKNRESMILPEIAEGLYAYMVGIANEHQTQVHEIRGVEDRLHLLVSLPRTPFGL